MYYKYKIEKVITINMDVNTFEVILIF